MGERKREPNQKKKEKKKRLNLNLCVCICVCVCVCVCVFNRGFPGGSDGKESACNARDLDLIPGLGRHPGEGKATHTSITA